MKAVLIAAVALCAALAGCSDEVTFRYKLGLEVEVDGETKRAFTVVEANYGRGMDGSFSARITGEALVLEVRQGQLLVVLLGRMPDRTVWRFNRRGGWGENGPTVGLLGRKFEVPDEKEWTARLRKIVKQQGARELELTALPDLVTFDDFANPATVREVDAENLAGTFGPGARLSRATVEITTEPIAREIQTKLRWPEIVWKKGYLGGDYMASTNNLANRLTTFSLRGSGTS